MSLNKFILNIPEKEKPSKAKTKQIHKRQNKIEQNKDNEHLAF